MSIGSESTYALISKLPFPKNRAPERNASWQLPQNTPVISADNHLSIGEDIWFDRFPARLKDRAPRVWQKNGVWHVGFDGKSLFPDLLEKSFGIFEPLPGAYALDRRLEDMAAEGIDKEIVFGNGIMALLQYSDVEIREWIFRSYNEYLADLGERSGGRFHGVAIPNFWDISKIRSSLAEIKALGIKTILLPMKPGKGPDGKEIAYADEEMEPFWHAIEECNLPICFHVGENVADGHRGMLGISFMMNLGPFRKTVGELIFGGILDRHPSLKVVFVEGGINWIANAKQDAELVHGSFGSLLDWEIRQAPAYYFDNHVYSTFMTDALGLQLLDRIGADRIMWTVDYPHAESTFGYSRTAMKMIFDATSEANARKIVGGTALELFNLC
jgi:predicted TIM-barrel fold metal-dependent hydrolase